MQHPWGTCVDEDGPEGMTGLLGLAKLIVFGRWAQRAAFPGLWQHSNKVAFLGPLNVTVEDVEDGFGLMAERCYPRETHSV